MVERKTEWELGVEHAAAAQEEEKARGQRMCVEKVGERSEEVFGIAARGGQGGREELPGDSGTPRQRWIECCVGAGYCLATTLCECLTGLTNH